MMVELEKQIDNTLQNMENKSVNEGLTELEKIFKSLDKNDKSKFLDVLQRRNDVCYEKENLSSKVLELQVWINSKRHEEDIVDGREIINRFSDGNFVQ